MYRYVAQHTDKPSIGYHHPMTSYLEALDGLRISDERRAVEVVELKVRLAQIHTALVTLGMDIDLEQPREYLKAQVVRLQALTTKAIE
jgi:hypothetical protein